ncbi:MAG: hypothetical protein HFH24_07770 [Ruminococcus sp.]|nr:hypothetical protein [Ruminococcus sp.]
MKINETTEKDLKVASEIFSMSVQGIQAAENEIQTLNMGNDTDENDDGDASPLRFLSRAEALEWNKLTQSRQEEFLREGKKEIPFEDGVPGNLPVYNGREDPVTVIPIQQNSHREADQKQKAESSTYQKGNRRNTNRQNGKEDNPKYSSNIPASRNPTNTGSMASGSGAAYGKGMAVSGKGTAAGGVAQSVPKGATGTVVTVAVQAGKRTAGKFREYLEMQASAKEQMIHQAQQKLKNYQEVNAAIGTLPSSVQYFGAFVVSAVLAVAAVIVQAVSAIVAGLISMVIAVLVTIVVVFAIVSVIVSAIAALLQESNPGGYGMPVFVTSDMMQVFFEVQEEYGIPVSTGVAQLIAESGFGLYGPGGDTGEGLSQLAYDYKNLFGIKYFSSDQYATGVVDMTTGEQDAAGGMTTIVAGFSVYPDYASCIRQRAWMLDREPYASRVESYRNPNDGSYTREQAQGFINGIREAGWATDISYVQKCIQHMDNYNLYRFDNMTWEQFQAGGAGVNYDGTVTPVMQVIVDTAQTNSGIYPCTSDMCAQWVTGVFIASDASVIPYGNAIDMWNNYRTTGSTDMENIPPGAIVCGSGYGEMGAIYGHVGIYIGNGMVANNRGYFSIETVEEWSSWQTATCQGYTGWIGWVFPGGVPSE